MRDFLIDFHSKVQEIEQYFEFVAKINEVESHRRDTILFPDQTQYVVNHDLQKILRANCYLLLYNLIESSIRNGIIAIYDAIHRERLSYTEVGSRIQTIWLTQRCRGLTDPSIRKETIVKTVAEILEEVNQTSPLSLEKSQLRISGNLDWELIEELIKQYGFFGSIAQNKKVAVSHLKLALGTIKRMRNSIAHGNVSFSEAARNTTMRELIDYKDRTVSYLTDVLKNIDDYISRQKYK